MASPRRAILLLAWVLFAWGAAVGCDESFPEPADPPASKTATLASDQAALAVSVDDLRLTLTWGEAGRTAIDLGRLRLGRVAQFDVDRNYDPSTLASFPVADLSWLHPVSAKLLRPESGKPALGGYDDPTQAWLALETVDEQGVAGPPWHLRIVAQSHGTFRCELQPAQVALREAIAAESPEDLFVLTDLPVEVTPSERFYGLGERFDAPEHHGRTRRMHMVADFSTESGYNEVHVPIPLLIGTRGWGLFVQSRRPAVFDVGKTEPERVHAVFNDPTLRFYLIAAAHPLDVPGAYTRLTGAPAMPATWAFGPIIWRNENKSQAEVLDDMQQIRDHDLAISAMWLDRPFDTHVNNFGFDPKRFPDPDAMIAKVQALGMRMGMWSTPYAEKGSDFHDEIVAKGWYVGLPAIVKGVVKWGGPIDLTHPDAFAFWKQAISKAAKRGIEGWKLDFAEDVHVGLGKLRVHYTFADGSDERTMHHGYPLPYHRAYHENLPEGGGFLLCRAGTFGDQVYSSMIWPGDLDNNLMAHGECDDAGTCHVGGLPASFSAMLSLSTSGYPLYAADTGGYRHGRPTKHTFMRWIAQTGLSAAMQIGGGQQSNPWDFKKYGDSVFDQEVLDAARYYTRLHTRLFPYLYTAMHRARDHQRGPVRPFGMAHPELQGHPLFDALADTQHYLGEALLVAPVLDTAPGRKVLLPPGEFFDWWTHEKVAGDPAAARVLDLTVPLDRIPLYVPAGGVLPLLRPTIDTLAPATEPGVDSYAADPGRLHLLIAPGPDAHTALWDGSDVRTRGAGGGVEVQFKHGSVFKQGVQIELWRADPPSDVKLGGQSMGGQAPESARATCASCWWHDAGLRQLVVRLPAGDHSVICGP